MIFTWSMGIAAVTAFPLAYGPQDLFQAVGFGVLGLIVALRDLHGLIVKNDSFARRILDHLVASSLAVVVGFSAFLNTQFYRLTHLDWLLDQKMLLPVAVALPLLTWELLLWSKRLRLQHSAADILRGSGA